MKQGENRFARYQNLKAQVEKDTHRSKVTVFHTFDSIAHESLKAYTDPFFVEYIRG